MMRSWLGGCVLLLAVAAAMPAAHAQSGVYATFTASQLTGGPQGDYLYGATGGLLVGVHSPVKFVTLQGDIQGRFVGKNGERFDGASVGGRIGVPLHLLGLTPYAEFAVGFARYNDGANNATTDIEYQVNPGLEKRLTAHVDAVVEYSYEPYYAIKNFYTPQNFSAGLIYRFERK